MPTSTEWEALTHGVLLHLTNILLMQANHTTWSSFSNNAYFLRNNQVLSYILDVVMVINRETSILGATNYFIFLRCCTVFSDTTSLFTRKIYAFTFPIDYCWCFFFMCHAFLLKKDYVNQKEIITFVA